MPYIALKTTHGKYVGPEAGAPASLTCMSEEPVLFDRIDAGDGNVMLRILSTGQFVTLAGQDGQRWLIPGDGEPGPVSLLRFVPLEDDRVAIQPSGASQYLSASNGGTVHLGAATTIGNAESFVVEARDRE